MKELAFDNRNVPYKPVPGSYNPMARMIQNHIANQHDRSEEV